MIQIKNASFTYKGASRKSLDDVTFAAKRGECILVTGPSGCGKSTLLRLINGMIPHFYPGDLSGSITVSGVCPGEVPLYAMADKVSTVLQNPKSQFYTTDTVSELAFALENRGLPEDKILSRIERTVNDLSLEKLMGRSMFSLSGGEKQRIACACAAAADTDLIVMDEPTANLDYVSSLQLGEMIRYWKSQGKTVIIAEHRIAWVYNVITRMLVMKGGQIVCDFSPAGDIEQAPAHGASIPAEKARNGKDIFSRYGLRTRLLEDPAKLNLPVWNGDGRKGIEIHNLCFSYDGREPVLKKDHIALAPHKITAVVGKNGRGKTTFLRCLAGLERKDKSIVSFEGKVLPRRDRQKKIYLIAQDVNYQLFTQEVREEIEISLPKEMQKDPALSQKETEEIASRLDVTGLLDMDPASLSGGQKQRTAIAGAIASKREILLFDEPTSGLDLSHMQEIADLMKRESAAGKTIVVVTHDSELIRACADYKLVF